MDKLPILSYSVESADGWATSSVEPTDGWDTYSVKPTNGWATSSVKPTDGWATYSVEPTDRLPSQSSLLMGYTYIARRLNTSLYVLNYTYKIYGE